MSQLKGSTCLTVVILMLGLITSDPLRAAGPQVALANWDNLKQLAPGQQIKVVLNDAKSYRGKLQTMSDEAIVVHLATGEQSFARQSVLRVSSKGQSHRWRNAAIGTAAGLGAGFLIGAKASSGSEIAPIIYLMAVPISAGAGAGVGAALPTGRWYDVYRAR